MPGITVIAGIFYSSFQEPGPETLSIILISMAVHDSNGRSD